MLRFVFLFITIAVINSADIYAIDYTYTLKNQYKVGKTPIKIFKISNSEKVHIICAGEDLDYDDSLEEGEEAPSWWILDNPDSTPRKVLEFDRYLKSRPFRPAVDETNGMLYVPLVGKIVALDLIEEEISDDMLTALDAHSISIAGGHLLITISPGFGEIGRVDVFNLQTRKVLQSIKGGVNILDCIHFTGNEGLSIAILNQGNFGSDSSTVMYGKITHMFDFELDNEVLIGNTGNHINFDNGKIYATVNMSHKIAVIDVNTNEVNFWNTGTIGWNGPREAVVNGNDLFVTTYTGDVRHFDTKTGLLTNIYSQYGHKAENLSIDDDSYFLAYPYDEYYSPDNTIYYFEKEIVSHQMEKIIEVGKFPLGLVKDKNGDVHVFCAGDDESGENPSWWTIYPYNMADFTVVKNYEFSANDIKAPFFPAIDNKNDKIYIPTNGSIKCFNLTNFILDDTFVSNFDAEALDFADNKLFAAIRYPDVPDSVVVINAKTGSEIQKINAGNYVWDVKHYEVINEDGSSEQSLAILTYDETDTYQSRLLYGRTNNIEDFSLENEALVGFAATNIAVGDKNKLAVATNFSDDVFVINPLNNAISNLKAGTQGQPNGPMTIQPVDGLGFYLGTFGGQLTNVRVSTNDFDEAYDLHLREIFSAGMPVYSLIYEVDQNSSFLAFTSPMDRSFESNNIVKIYTTGVTSVRNFNNGDISTVKIYPNPANEFVVIEAEMNSFGSSDISLEIYSITGAKLSSVNLPSSQQINHKFSISELGLTSGTYILHITTNMEVKALPFNIVK